MDPQTATQLSIIDNYRLVLPSLLRSRHCLNSNSNSNSKLVLAASPDNDDDDDDDDDTE